MTTFLDLTTCVERKMDSGEDRVVRRILDYWYVCGRRATRGAAGLDRAVSGVAWTAHLQLLWGDYLRYYEELRADHAARKLGADELDVYIELARVVRGVRDLVGPAAGGGLAAVSELDLLDVFYSWDEAGRTRRLQAYLFTNTDLVPVAELEKLLTGVLAAVGRCLE